MGVENVGNLFCVFIVWEGSGEREIDIEWCLVVFNVRAN